MKSFDEIVLAKTHLTPAEIVKREQRNTPTNNTNVLIEKGYEFQVDDFKPKAYSLTACGYWIRKQA